MTEGNELEELSEWERKAGEYQKHVFTKYGWSIVSLFASAVYEQLSDTIESLELDGCMREWIGENWLGSLSEYATGLVLAAHAMCPDWGDEADSRMVRFLDCRLGNWYGAYGVDQFPVEQITDAVMAVYDEYRDGLEDMV